MAREHGAYGFQGAGGEPVRALNGYGDLNERSNHFSTLAAVSYH